MKTLPFSHIRIGQTGVLIEGNKHTSIIKTEDHSCEELTTGKDIIPLPWNRVHLCRPARSPLTMDEVSRVITALEGLPMLQRQAS